MPVIPNFIDPITIPLEKIIYQISLPKLTISTIEDTNKKVSLSDISIFIYWTGVSIFLINFIYGCAQIFKIYQHGRKKIILGINTVISNKMINPFSFLNNIFINEDLLTHDDIEIILQHEKIHLTQKHSLDNIFISIIHIFFWFNPILFFFKSAIRENHEFIADARLQNMVKKQDYVKILLNFRETMNDLKLANHFINSLFKKRITMMNKPPTSNFWRISYLFVLPLTFGLQSFFIEGPSKAPILDEMPFTKATIKMLDSRVKKESNISIPKNEVSKISDSNLNMPRKKEVSEYVHIITRDSIYDVVDQMPMFPGCDHLDDYETKNKCSYTELFTYISQHLNYPTEAKEKGIKGTTIIEFIVRKDGSVTGENIIRSIHSSCDEALLKIFNKMKEDGIVWIPGRHEGNNVNVLIRLPVKFSLDN